MSHISFPRFASHAASGRGPLGSDQLRRLVPSAFATHAHESRSERHTYIPTSAVIDGLRANGFEPTFAKQGRSSFSSPPVDLECLALCVRRLDVTLALGIQGWDDRTS